MAKMVLGDVCIEVCLKSDPELRRGREVLGEAKDGVGRDCPLAKNDLIDPPRMDANAEGKP